MGSTGETGLLPDILRAALAAGLDILLSGVDAQLASRLVNRIPERADHWVHGRRFDPGSSLERAMLDGIVITALRVPP